jgi:hypothetical protein
MAYADVSDIEARWRALDADEAERAAVLLEDASAMLAARVDVDASDQAQAAALKMVACSMVIRVMGAGGAGGAYGATSASMTGGPYSQTWTYEAPVGDMYITKSERAMLGIGAMSIGSIRPMVAGEHPDD